MDYLEHMAERLAGREKSVPGWLGHKKSVREFAKYVGVATPEIYFRGTLSELRDLPSGKYVMKPEFASTSIGVMLLETFPGQKCKNLLTNEVLSFLELRSKCEAVAEKVLGSSDSLDAVFVIEELLQSPDGSFPPPDIRFYAFQGKIGLILMEHHIAGPAEAMYFDENFQPIKDVHSKYGTASGVKHLESIVNAVSPANASSILRTAKRISAAIPSAFCRIDLYDTSHGTVLGELTFTPGTFYYKNRKLMSEAESLRLGRMWDQALEEID